VTKTADEQLAEHLPRLEVPVLDQPSIPTVQPAKMNVTGRGIDIILKIIHILLATIVIEKVIARMFVGFYTQKRNQNDLKSEPNLSKLPWQLQMPDLQQPASWQVTETFFSLTSICMRSLPSI
jgi:hypothetical protein